MRVLGSERIDSVRAKKAGHWRRQAFALAAENGGLAGGGQCTGGAGWWGPVHRVCWAGGGQCTGFAGLVGGPVHRRLSTLHPIVHLLLCLLSFIISMAIQT